MDNSDKSIIPEYEDESRMKYYDIIFDSEIQQNRVGMYNHEKVDTLKEDWEDDEYYTIEKGFSYRLDLISFKFYGTAAYDWLIAQYNNIEDPIREIVAGKIISIPNRNRVLGY